jgi:hypothetical protein
VPGAQAQRGGPPGALALGAGGRGQLAARARVRALGERAVRRRRGLADLRARAEARVDETGRVEPGDRLVVQPEPLGLADDGAVPVEPQRGQVAELLALEARPHAARVEVLTRTRNRDPADRANSQASSAVRRLPRCSEPVGEGA